MVRNGLRFFETRLQLLLTLRFTLINNPPTPTSQQLDKFCCWYCLGRGLERGWQRDGGVTFYSIHLSARCNNAIQYNNNNNNNNNSTFDIALYPSLMMFWSAFLDSLSCSSFSEKKWVLSDVLNWVTDLHDLMLGGSLFHSVGATTLKWNEYVV